MSLLSMTQGDKHTFDVALTDAAGAPLDLTSVDITFTAKRRLSDADADALIQKTTASGITVDADPTTGLATLVIDAADTVGLASGPALFWDLQIDDGAGDVRTPLSGRLAIASDVTRSSGGS